MRKHKVVILCLLTVMLLTAVTTVGEVYLTNTEHGMTGMTTVKLVIPASYTVNIPAAMDIPYGATSTPMTIGVSSIKIGSHQAVKIAVDSAKGRLLPESGNTLIPYKLLCDGKEFSRALYTTVDDTQLSLDIALEDWFEADAGEYTGTITFHVSLEDQEVAQ